MSVNNRQRLPSLVREDAYHLKAKIQDLESQCANYKARLDSLRKAKNNLVIKKTTEYIKTNPPALDNREKSEPEIDQVQPVPVVDPEICQEHERIIERLTSDLSESDNLNAALRLENEDLRTAIEKNKSAYQIELANACAKQEETQREVKNWENMYNEWMKVMEERVGNITQTHTMLQRCMEETDPSNGDKA